MCQCPVPTSLRARAWPLGPVLWASLGIGGGAGAQEFEFHRDIRPILSEHCYQCHGPGLRKPKGGLDLSDRAVATAPRDQRLPAITPGVAKDSELIHRVRTADPKKRMPPPSSGAALTREQVGMLERWIDGGARFEKHWAFVRPRRPKIPAVGGGHPIDGFVRRRLQTAGFRPARKADPRTLIRRVSFDLLGLPPNPGQVTAFVADRRPDAYGRLVRGLLGSPHFAERMAQEWLDAARYADTTGFAADRPRTMWHYRDWVIDAFRTNMPFDQFTIEQLAGDLLPDATQSQRIATGMLRNSMQALGNNPPKEEFRIKGVVDRVDTIGRTWLGLTMACAECHDHKYDPVSQEEYYQLFAILNNVPHHGSGFDVHGPRIRVDPVDRGAMRATGKHTPKAKNRLQRIAALRGELHQQLGVGRNSAGAIAHWPLSGHRRDVAMRPARQVKSGPFRYGPGPVRNSRSMKFRKGQFVRLRRATKLDVDGQVALSAWIRTRSGVANIVSKYDWNSGQRSFVFGIGGEGLEGEHAGRLFAWVSSTASQWQGMEIYGSHAIHDGEWHHVALLFEPGRPLQLYVDGVEDDSAERKGVSPRSIAISDRDFVIGAGYSASEAPDDFFFEGDLADVRIDRTLPFGDRARIADIHRRLRALQPFGKSRPPRRLTLDDPDAAQVLVEMETPRATYVHVRGDFENRGKRVFPGVPAVLGRLPNGERGNRLDLARWLVNGENPLVARVFVNRLWQQFFGTGLVKTVEDFGNQGEWPSHPELLDWLAVEFVESGWDVRHMVELIVTSETYQQRSHMRRESLARDFHNRMLARAPRLRLPAEQVRDSVLAISGLLDRRVGGPSVFPPQPAHIGEFRDKTAGAWRTSVGGDRHRRSLYTFWQRMYPYPSLVIFDAPNRERSCVRRSRSNTPLQALVLWNDPVFFAAARAFGARILSAGGGGDEARLRFAFDLSVGRMPREDERRLFAGFLEKQRQRFRANPESAAEVVAGRKVGGVTSIELAAWTMAASTLLSLDETITRQ